MLVLLRVKGDIPLYVRIRMSALDAEGCHIITADIHEHELQLLEKEPNVLSVQPSKRLYVL